MSKVILPHCLIFVNLRINHGQLKKACFRFIRLQSRLFLKKLPNNFDGILKFFGSCSDGEYQKIMNLFGLFVHLTDFGFRQEIICCQLICGQLNGDLNTDILFGSAYYFFLADAFGAFFGFFAGFCGFSSSLSGGEMPSSASFSSSFTNASL